ncbi:hypothetical protein KCU71_g12468, partial [Aureobasidium melanogenum]
MNKDMDEFAQTGAQQDDLFDDIQYDQSMQTRGDDLFSDEIQPMNQETHHIAEPEKQEEPNKQPEVQEPAAIAESVPEPSIIPTESAPAPTTSAPARGGRGGTRGRGRGRGRNHQDRGNQDRPNQGRNDQAGPNPDRDTNEPRRNNNDSRRNNQERNKKESQPKDAPNVQQEQQQQQSSSNTTAESSKPATNAVRGDRTATGGLRKPKLSEQELAEKMSRISLKNEKLAAAHARAEADAADFAEREEVAAKRRQEERRERQQMMGEREKNRLRKLKAVGGREWDAEKPEDADAFGGPRQPGGRGRGAYGGVASQRNPDGSREGFGGDREDYTDGREYMYREDRGRGRGRGRGGRGGGSGRGGRNPQQEKSVSQSVPKPTDFPDLSSSASAPKFDNAPPPTMAFPTKAKMEKLDIDDQITPGTEKKSWADMME